MRVALGGPRKHLRLRNEFWNGAKWRNLCAYRGALWLLMLWGLGALHQRPG